MADVCRHEIKYIISAREAELLKYRLRALLRPDGHVRSDGGYFIRSLYFDDIDYRAYHEKLSGIKERTKYRIRFYNMDDSLIMLEKKSKNGDLTGKESVRISRSLAESYITAGEELHHTESGLAREMARLRLGAWKPVVLVDYTRYPLVYPTGNVRVTIDTDLRTAPFQTGLFDERLLTVPVLNDGEAVLEVKYDAFLPAPVRAILEGIPRERCAVSKYTKCLNILE